jgi:hypothetical protein
MNLPLLFHQGLFEVLAVATNSSSSVPPHWNLLNSYYEKMSYEMLIDIMFSTVILVRSHGKLSWELAREIPNNAVSRSIFMRLSSLARKNEQNLRDLICNNFVNSVGWSRETFSSEDVSLLLLSSSVYSFLSCHHKFYIPYCSVPVRFLRTECGDCFKPSRRSPPHDPLPVGASLKLAA